MADNNNHQPTRAFQHISNTVSVACHVRMRRTVCATLAGIAFAYATCGHAATTNKAYPAQPIRIVVGLPPGEGVDLVARAVGQKLSELWSVPVIIDNRSGAGGAVAMEIVAHGAPDGYTLLAGSMTTIASATPLKKITFDARSGLAPVVQMNSQPYILAASPTLAVTSVSEMIAYAKANPGRMNYASGGVGSTSHVGMELLKSAAGINIVHVPYRGLGLAMTDVISGQIQLMMGAALFISPNIKSGKLKALATGGLRRSAAYPDLPTISESGLPGFEWTNSYALFAPPKTPVAIIAALNREAARIVNLPDVQKKLASDGVEPAAPNTPQQFTAKFQGEVDRLTKFFVSSGIKL